MYIDLKGYWLKYETPLTYDLLEKHEWLEQEVILCIQKCFEESRSFMSKKVSDWIRLDNQEINNIKDWKIKSQDMHTARKMYSANFMNEWLYPVFEWVEYWDQDIASDLTKVAKYDQDRMRLQIKFKQLTDNIFDYWAGIVIEEWIDNANKTIVPTVFNPKSYYPDPLWNYIDNNFRRHMFGAVVTKAELQEANDIVWEEVYHEIDELIWGYSYDEQFKRWNSKAIRWYNQISYGEEIYVTHAFIEINGIRYRATLGNANTHILRREHLEALSPSERKNKCTVPYPVAIICPYPIENDIFWVSPRELMFDFARAINKLVNSVYRKELRNAGGDIYFVDSAINLADIAVKDDSWPVFVPYQNIKDVPNPMTKASEYADTTGTMNFYQRLKSRWQENTGITDIKMWNPDQNATLWQMEQQLTQSDIMFWLDVDMICEGMKYFWKNIWLRWLRGNIKNRWEKYISINGYMWNSSIIKLKNSDLIGSDDPNVTVISKRKKDRENKKKLAQLQAFYPLEQADPNTSPIVNKMFKRDMYRMAWFDEDQVFAYCPLDANERHCIGIMNLVNQDIQPKVPIIPWLDLQTLWIYLNMCIDNDTKKELIRQLNLIMIEEWISKPQVSNDQMKWLQNSMTSQMVSNNLATNQKEWDQASF